MKIQSIRSTFTFYVIIVFFIGVGLISSCGKTNEDSPEKTLDAPHLQGDTNQETGNKAQLIEPDPSDTLVKIGVVGAHSGELAPYGIPTLNAVKMVVDEINHKGGFLGKKIKVISADDTCSPSVASQKAEQMIREKVVAVIGHTCSSSTLSALPFYNKSGVLCISPSATNADLTLSGNYPYFFRSVANDKIQAKVQVDFAIHRLHAQKAAILYVKDDYGKGMASLARQYFEESGLVTVTLFESVTQGLSDFSQVVEKIKKSGSDLVVWEGYYPEAFLLIKQMRSKNIKASLIGSDGIHVDKFVKAVREWPEDIYATSPQGWEKKNIIAIKAINDYKARFGSDPGPFFINAYSSAMALTNAMKRSESTECSDLAKTLRSEFVDTPLGRISFDEKGDVVGTSFSVYQLKGLSFKEVWP